MPGLMRHVRACNNAVLPGGRVVLRLGGASIGWVLPEVAARLGDVVPGTLHARARALAEAGLCRFRDEAFDVRASPDGPVLDVVDRGALPLLGIEAVGVHLNGLVRRADGVWIWVARRAADKLLDPGKLDHLVAGGVAAGSTAWETLVKEAGEEASVPAGLIASARQVGVVEYAMERDEGLRRDRLVIFDLDLPDDFVPVPGDGEVAGFELMPLSKVYRLVRETDAFKFNVNLVLIDLFLREGMVPATESIALRDALSAPAGRR